MKKEYYVRFIIPNNLTIIGDMLHCQAFRKIVHERIGEWDLHQTTQKKYDISNSMKMDRVLYKKCAMEMLGRMNIETKSLLFIMYPYLEKNGKMEDFIVNFFEKRNPMIAYNFSEVDKNSTIIGEKNER